LALLWGTACAIRAIAFRSLQIFRALLPSTTPSDLALLLARLSNTISAPEENIRSFSNELIHTLKLLGSCSLFDTSLLPQMLWCACACLSTTVETEFLQALAFLESVLGHLDLDDEQTINTLISQRPAEWKGAKYLQSPLLVGLRSSVTSDATFKMLQTLAKVTDSSIIDPTRGRVRDLYTVALPWCYRSMTEETSDPALQTFAQDVGYLAEQEGRSSICRIMASFIKGRFRTKEDFLRQSVASLREHYGDEDWTEVVTLLLGLVLNSHKWLRVSALQILKVLFQQRETRNPVELLGSELLMPLLRLLETDLAHAALEVLQEPMTISGGPPAKQVLRMSMQLKSLTKDVESMTDIFGIPEASGWCIAQPERSQDICRSNIMAVFETCKVPSRPSQIHFEPEDVERLASPAPTEDDDLGGLVQNLHELSSFFQGDSPAAESAPPSTEPSQLLEARVAAILAKSTESSTDLPQTPFIDVFHVESAAAGAFEQGGSDDDTDYSSDSDAFVYDSPAALRVMRGINGFRR
jgi:furry protein family